MSKDLARALEVEPCFGGVMLRLRGTPLDLQWVSVASAEDLARRLLEAVEAAQPGAASGGRR